MVFADLFPVCSKLHRQIDVFGLGNPLWKDIFHHPLLTSYAFLVEFQLSFLGGGGTGSKEIFRVAQCTLAL